MKKNQLFKTASIALLLGLMSCTHDVTPDNPTNVEAKNVFLKMKNVPTIAQRADSETATDKKATFSTGVVIFVTGDVITRYVSIDDLGTTTYTPPTNATVPTIKPASMETGVNFTNIKSDRVYIIGNRTLSQLDGLPAQNPDGSIVGGVRMSSVIKDPDTWLHVSKDGDLSSGTQDNVALYGVNGLVVDPGSATGDDFTTTVTLAPIVARIEIERIIGEDLSFKLAGIFINNYHEMSQVDGLIPAVSTLINNGSDVDKYLATYQAPALHDWSDAGLGFSTAIATRPFVVSPTHKWGYNFFASKGATNMPRIVLRLKEAKDNTGNLIVNGSAVAVDRFVTVKGFNDGTDPITEFKAGYVYTITDIQFDKNHTTEHPEIEDRVINATVTVTIAQWVTGGRIYPEI